MHFAKEALDLYSHRLKFPPKINHRQSRYVAKAFPSDELVRLSNLWAIEAARQWHLDVLKSDDELDEPADDTSLILPTSLCVVSKS